MDHAIKDVPEKVSIIMADRVVLTINFLRGLVFKDCLRMTVGVKVPQPGSVILIFV